MSGRTRYLLLYDIRHAKRLRRVHDVAKSYGEPLQYSVFVCDLSRSELTYLRSDLLTEMNVSIDSIAIFDLGPPQGRAVECVEFIGPHQPLPEDGPTIW